MINLTVDQALWVYRFLEGGPIGDIGEEVQRTIKQQIEDALTFQDECSR